MSWPHVAVDRRMAEQELIDEPGRELDGHEPIGAADARESVLRLVRATRSGFLWERRSGANALADLRGVPAGLEGLVAESLLLVTSDPDARTREAGARGLGRHAGPEPDRAIECLLGAVEDQNPYVSASAIHALGQLRAEPARGAILNCLEDSNPRVVAAAIGAVGRLGPAALGAQLLRFLDVSQPYILAAAAVAVGRLGCADAGPALLRNLRGLAAQPEAEPPSGGRELRAYHLPRCHIQALVQVRHLDAVPVLIEIALRNVGLRSTATTALRDLDARQAAGALAWMLRDPGTKLRHSLLQLLERADLPETLPFVRPLLDDAAAENRRLAVTLVGRWGDLGSLERVRRMAAAEPNPYARPQAVRALAALVGPAGLAELSAFVGDPNASVRLAVAEGIASWANPPAGAAALLDRLAVDREPRVVQAAIAAQDQLRIRSVGPSSASRPEPAVALVPEDIRGQAFELQEVLLGWREGLAARQSLVAPDALAETDNALTHLIGLLVRTQAPEAAQA